MTLLYISTMTLASLIGSWLSERARLETVPVKNALLTMAKNLGEASALLSGLETGVRSDTELAVASRVQNLMALNPTIGSRDSAQPASSRHSSRRRCVLQATSRATNASNAARIVSGRHDDKILLRGDQFCRRVNR